MFGQLATTIIIIALIIITLGTMGSFVTLIITVSSAINYAECHYAEGRNV
jgi:hypothetical protein